MRSQFTMRNEAAMHTPEHASYAPPGAIDATNRQRMLNSLTLDQMDEYSYLDAAGRSMFEDRWLTEHPAGTTTNGYRFAEDVLGMANGTFAAILASNDRAASEALAARTRQALADMQLRRDAATMPLEMRRLDLQIATLENQRQIAFASSQQGGINTTTMVVGGVIAVGMVAAAYAISARKNPVVTRGKSRMFLPMHLLSKSERAKWNKRLYR